MKNDAILLWLTRLAALVCVLTIVVLSLVPGDDRPHVLESGNIEHFIAYAGTAFVVALGFRVRIALAAVVGLSVASGLFEVAQIFIPGRSPGVDNWAASSCGAVAGGVLGVLMVKAIVRLRTA